MGFFPVVVFCASFAAGDNTFTDAGACIFVDDTTHAYETETACSIHALGMKDDVVIMRNVQQGLFSAFGPEAMPVHWYTFCVKDTEIRQFYMGIGVDPSDLPESL